MHVLTVPNQKATANYVPAAGVIRRWQALSGIIGVARRLLSLMKAHGSTVEGHWKLENLSARGKWNSMCSGEMRRDMEEHQWRRRLSGL